MTVTKTMLEMIEAKCFDFSEAKITDDGVIKNVHFIGYQAKNTKIKSKGPYKYTPAAVEEAVKAKHYDGLDVYLGHPADPTKDRDPKDKLGYTSNSNFQEATGGHGDIICNTAHPYYPAVQWWVKNQPNRLGASHRADCAFDEAANEVCEIIKVKSLDLVSNSSTTTGMFAEGVIGEQVALKDDQCRLNDLMDAFNTLLYEAKWPLGQSLTPADVAVRISAVVKDLASELEKFKPTDPTTATQESIMDLTKLTLDELKKARPDLLAVACDEAIKAERILDTEIEEAIKDLPIEARTPIFKKIVRNAKKAGEDIAPLIADRKIVVKEMVEAVIPGQAAGTVVKPADDKKKPETTAPVTKVPFNSDSIRASLNK